MKYLSYAFLALLTAFPFVSRASIASKLNDLEDCRVAITNAIVEKGGVASGALTNVPNEILAIPAWSQSVTNNVFVENSTNLTVITKEIVVETVTNGVYDLVDYVSYTGEGFFAPFYISRISDLIGIDFKRNDNSGNWIYNNAQWDGSLKYYSGSICYFTTSKKFVLFSGSELNRVEVIINNVICYVNGVANSGVQDSNPAGGNVNMFMSNCNADIYRIFVSKYPDRSLTYNALPAVKRDGNVSGLLWCYDGGVNFQEITGTVASSNTTNTYYDVSTVQTIQTVTNIITATVGRDVEMACENGVIFEVQGN